MKSIRRSLAIAALGAVIGATACGDYAYVAPEAPAPPPPPPAAPAPPAPPPPKLIGAQLDIAGEIEFAPGKATIKESSASEDVLNQVLNVLQTTPALTKLRVENHTDAQSRKLSQGRAQSVVKWLEDKGIASSRLSAVGCGTKGPLFPNDTAEHRERNRRTEFDVEEMDGKRPDAYTKPCSPNPAREH